MENRKSNSKLFRGTEGTQKFDVPIGLSGCFEKVRIKGGTGKEGGNVDTMSLKSIKSNYI